MTLRKDWRFCQMSQRTAVGALLLLLSSLLFTGEAPPLRADAPAPVSILLFDSGKEGYPRYRIPALVTTTKGTVLAICEGRKNGRGLTGPIDIVLKRSSDGGKTWSPLQVAVAGNGDTLGNPCPVVDRRDGTVWLALTRSLGADTEETIVAGTSRDVTRVFVTFSKNDGKTWAPIRDISASARRPDMTWYGTGPRHRRAAQGRQTCHPELPCGTRYENVP